MSAPVIEPSLNYSTTKPDISVVIPCLNEQDHIVSTIENALDVLEPLSLEIVIVDGGSSDNTVDNIKLRFNKQVMVLASNKKGRAYQMQMGASYSHGTCLLFLHADTKLAKGAGQSLQQFLSSKHQWGFFLLRMDNPLARFSLLSFMINTRSSLSQIATGDQCQFVRTDAYRRIGGLPKQALMEDIELSRRLKKITRAFIVKERVTTSARRWEKGGFIKTILLMWSLRLRYWLGEHPDTLHRRYYQ